VWRNYLSCNLARIWCKAVSFDELTSNPYETKESIYNGLEGMNQVFQEDSDSVYPCKLKEYCEKNLKGYRKNQPV
jgi:hypothetical protein